MTFLLEHLQIPVVGYSLPPEKDSLFARAERISAIPEVFADVRDKQEIENFLDKHRPSTIIHMAAQPLVLKSYANPRETFEINVIGTANLLDVAFKKNFVKVIVVVTTDKVYRNDNSGRAFVETDPLGGKDPYSASKVGTESVVAAWQQIAKVSDGPLVIAVRGGNVVGGGDYAIDRLIPDLVRGIKERKPTSIRNPESVRPWQHVLDLSVGYLSVLEQSLVNPTLPAFNFGPNESGLSVSEVAIIGKSVISETSWEVIDLDNVAGEIEASKLNLDSENAREKLGWSPRWSQKEAVQNTFTWWKDYMDNPKNAGDLCKRTVEEFMNVVK